MSGKTDHVGFTAMKKLEQDHLHPLLEHPRLTCLGRESNTGLQGGKRQNEHSSKELFEQHVNSYSEHLHELP